MGFIKDLFGNKKGEKDWIFADDGDRSVAIPADGNHPVFKEGGSVIVPKNVKKEERRINGDNSTGKKYFF